MLKPQQLTWMKRDLQSQLDNLPGEINDFMRNSSRLKWGDCLMPTWSGHINIRRKSHPLILLFPTLKHLTTLTSDQTQAHWHREYFMDSRASGSTRKCSLFQRVLVKSSSSIIPLEIWGLGTSIRVCEDIKLAIFLEKRRKRKRESPRAIEDSRAV